MNIKKIAKTNLEFMDCGIYNPDLKTVDSLLKNEDYNKKHIYFELIFKRHRKE